MVKQPPTTSSDDTTSNKPLQAILLADSFTQTFRPITLSPSTPRVLCPLNNVTLLDYSIEFLSNACIAELFIFCVSGGDAIQSHISSLPSQSKTMKIECIVEKNCQNAGDALRELDKRGLVRGDVFVLMHGDVVSNVDIGEVIRMHVERKKRDNAAIMTVLMKEVGGMEMVHCCEKETKWRRSNLRPVHDDLVVGLDARNDNRILLFDSNPGKSAVNIPCSFVSASSGGISIRRDLLDVGIDICSPEVLARFSDEFDYSEIRNHFLTNSVAEEEEGLQNKIHAHLLSRDEYAARVQDLRSYHQISRDLLRRWCYPIVPENLPTGYERRYRYVMGRHFVYREVKESRRRTVVGGVKEDGTRTARIARNAVIGGCTMIGANCFVGEMCRLRGTVIGHDVTIHPNTQIQSSHVWDNVQIFQNCQITDSLLCHGCIIKAGAVIRRGCVIGQKCVIGENVVLPEFTRVTLYGEEEDSDGEVWSDEDDNDEEEEEESSEEEEEEEKGIVSDYDIVGKDGLGRVWKPTPLLDDYDDDDDEDEDMDIYQRANHILQSQSMGYDPSPVYEKRLASQAKQAEEDEEDFLSEEDDDDDDMVFGTEPSTTFDEPSFQTTTTTPTTTPTSPFVIGRQRGIDVIKELKTICLEHDTSSPIENLTIELNSFKFSQNASFSDCVTATILAIAERLNVETLLETPVSLAAAFKRELIHWGPLLKKMCHSIVEEVRVLYALEDVAVQDDEEEEGGEGGKIGEVLCVAPAFRLVLQILHDEEVVNEEAILSWAEERRRGGDEGGKNEEKKEELFRQKETQEFLEWLEESSEESESGSEEESDEE